jgi:hypothetical protein
VNGQALHVPPDPVVGPKRREILREVVLDDGGVEGPRGDGTERPQSLVPSQMAQQRIGLVEILGLAGLPCGEVQPALLGRIHPLIMSAAGAATATSTPWPPP